MNTWRLGHRCAPAESMEPLLPFSRPGLCLALCLSSSACSVCSFSVASKVHFSTEAHLPEMGAASLRPAEQRTQRLWAETAGAAGVPRPTSKRELQFPAAPEEGASLHRDVAQARAVLFPPIPVVLIVLHGVRRSMQTGVFDRLSCRSCFSFITCAV